jgi:UDP-4-amino-4,6-dideoxy-N-acetyl-beta-L-altrosamine transaminase
MMRNADEVIDMTKDKLSFLPYGRHDIDEKDIEAVVQVLRGDWLTNGPAVEAFERALIERTGAQFAVSCSNGMTALHLAALASGIGPGQVAIVPAITFHATASAVLQTGADVVFADVDPDTGLMTANTLIDAIEAAKIIYPSTQVSCALPVHMAGLPADMAALQSVAEQNNLTLIEDAAHALGSVSDGAAIGACTRSRVTTFSFHPLKTITTGEGGAVTTNDEHVAEHMRRLRNHGIVRDASSFIDKVAGVENGQPNPWYYEIHEPGFNYRLCDIQCALGISQIKRLDSFIHQRRQLFQLYRELLRDTVGVRFAAGCDSSTTSWHLAIALIDFQALGVSRGNVMRALAKNYVGTQVHYMPLYRHPWWRGKMGPMSLPGAESYYAHALSFPLHPRMTQDDVRRVVAVLKIALGV